MFLSILFYCHWKPHLSSTQLRWESLRKGPQSISWWGVDLDMGWTVHSSLGGLAFVLYTVTCFTSTQDIINNRAPNWQRNHHSYFYIWNPNLIDLSGCELVIWACWFGVCICTECSGCHGIPIPDFCEGRTDWIYKKMSTEICL
jgi:hypothetical protein